MFTKRVRIIFYISLTLIALFYVIKKELYSSSPTTLKLPPKLDLQNGDIILRKETNRISDIFATINNLQYSHIGVVFLQDKRVKVVHIEDKEQKNDFQVLDFEEFIFYASGYAVYRPKHPVDSKKLELEIEKLRRSKPQFDMDFNGDESDNRLYCTELAFKLYNHSAHKKLQRVQESYMHYSFIPLSLFVQKSMFSLIYEAHGVKKD